MTKNMFKDCAESKLTVEKFATFKRNTIDVWKKYGCVKQQPCGFLIEKANLPENTIVYINQAYQSYEGNKKVYYVDYYLLAQANPFESSVTFLYPLKTSESLWFSDFFRRYRNVTLD